MDQNVVLEEYIEDVNLAVGREENIITEEGEFQEVEAEVVVLNSENFILEGDVLKIILPEELLKQNDQKEPNISIKTETKPEPKHREPEESTIRNVLKEKNHIENTEPEIKKEPKIETENEENDPKRRKKVNDNQKIVKLDVPKVKMERCIKCKQFLDNLIFYNGHPNNSVEEFIALTNDKLNLFTGEDEFSEERDEFPTHKITHFNVYDEKGHLCSFDAGLIEKNVPLYFSGYIKSIDEEDSSVENGVPAHDLGPINEWWMTGYDGGETLALCFSTGYAEYYLMEPSPDYEPIFNKVKEKINLSKLVVEFLLDNGYQNPTFEDLIQHIESFGHHTDVEDKLLQHAQFLCDQVVNIDTNLSDEERPMISYPCMRSLVSMAGVTFQKRKKMRRSEMKGTRNKKKIVWSKATTTKLVGDIFEGFFPDQLDKKDDKGPKKKRCGVCEACQSPDCGQCSHCKDMLKFGGSGRSKQACKTRRCPNMAIMDAELSDNEEEQEVKQEVESKKNVSKRVVHKVKWSGESTCFIKGRKCFESAIIGEDISVEPGDCVMLNSENPNEPLCVARIAYMYERLPQGAMFHGLIFCRGTDTILGECADPRELFVVDNCDDFPLGSIVRKAEVVFKTIPDNWFELGGETSLPQQLEDDGKTFFYNKRYDGQISRFTDFVEETNDPNKPCPSCRHKTELKKFHSPIHENGEILLRGERYKPGNGIFLKPDVYKFKKVTSDSDLEKPQRDIDETLYPEFWRKSSDNIKGSNNDTPDPFIIGLIEEVIQDEEVQIRARIFYRPQNTFTSGSISYAKDLNLVYWTEEEVITIADNIAGKCYLTYEGNVADVKSWSEDGPFRFYFNEKYDPVSRGFEELSGSAMKIGTSGKGKGLKVKGKAARAQEEAPAWKVLERPLNCMDIFAGCGGLSEGLHQAHIANTKWAIEIDPSAAEAFRLNHPNTKVFTDDCNEILKTVIAGNGKQRGLPCKGDVELLVGGPPCQGFSGMNRFNAGQYSAFKNSLVVSYLSYCEYYRPKYFILENVRNFVSFKKSIVLKLTLRCLLAIGYQVGFGVLQAGHYGVPQTRRRLIIMAAAPGYQLPKYPEPMHVFNKRTCQLSFVVDGFKFQTGSEWTESAPYRTITVRDAISDLPEIKNGWSKVEMPYDRDPITHFQKQIRGKIDRGILVDHICKEMSALVEGRISQIPTYAGADWRDLPNIEIKLKDGTMTNILRYPYRTKKQKVNEVPKGVCLCATGKGCDPADRQFNTLIPWCLPHTGDRHNHWAALYGRLEADGFFGTTITNPEPMGKQGRVLHPEQNRVVSVRECARSQGFPDRFKFYGSILDKHRQVGNAVPPPLGKAIGREIAKAFIASKIEMPEFK